MSKKNKKTEDKRKELQDFISRFSANASKAKQATSRAKQLDKIQLDEVKLSSRVNPFIRFDQTKKLHRLALEVENVSKGYGEDPLFKNLNLMIAAGDRVAIIEKGKIISLNSPEKLIDNLIASGFERKKEVKSANLEDVFLSLTGYEWRDE